MRGKLAILLALAASAGAGSIASAADLPVKAPPPKAVVALSWTGFYIGGHAGYGWGTSDWTFGDDDAFWNDNPGDQIGLRPRGGLGGLQIGYNYQFGQWLVGIEGTYAWANIRRQVISPYFPTSDVEETRIKSIYTVAGRLGYVAGPWLLYAKGGWAGARVKLEAVDFTFPDTWDVTQNRSGYVVGGGTEFMIGRNLILGVEYNYIDLSGKTYTATTPLNNFLTIVDDRTRLHTVVGRLSYLFGGWR